MAKVVLISTYELGRQPFGLASPAAWLRQRGHTVTCADLAVGSLPTLETREADFVAFYLPMHTATRLAAASIARVRQLNPDAALCCFGLYAPLNADYLRTLGVRHIIGGEFEQALCSLVEGAPLHQNISLDRLQFLPPDRTGLPLLSRYPKLAIDQERRLTGYTEASRGCKHRCRHCPVVPVYDGAFRIVQPEVVLEDIRRQVAAGAQHITFGDPDFLNGPAHAKRIADALHREFPTLTWDATAKVEHLLQHRNLLPLFRDTGCLFVITAVESVDDSVLQKLEKGHTRSDFLRVVELFRDTGLQLWPTFIPFTPWTTRQSYADLLETLLEYDLVGNVAPVQLTLRLLITSESRLLELDDIRAAIERYDEQSLAWTWRHTDAAMDVLAREVLGIVHTGTKAGTPRHAIFRNIWEHVHGRPIRENYDLTPRTTIPYMEEPWFC